MNNGRNEPHTYTHKHTQEKQKHFIHLFQSSMHLSYQRTALQNMQHILRLYVHLSTTYNKITFIQMIHNTKQNNFGCIFLF